MYPGWLVILSLVLSAVSITGLGLLGFAERKNREFLKSLFPKKGENFQDKLTEILREVGRVDEFRKQSLEYIQKVALKRYNPYQDTGGDQSFSVALLNRRGNGIVVTSLHSRSGTRVFAKPVAGGNAGKVELSKEEKEVVKEAYEYI